MVQTPQHSMRSLRNPPQTHLSSLITHYILLLPPTLKANFHVISEGVMYLRSSAHGAFPQSLECSSILSFKILIILKAQLNVTSLAKSIPM